MSDSDAERIAAQFHEAYERLAPNFGYVTKRESATRWAKLPENHKQLMIATVKDVFGNIF